MENVPKSVGIVLDGNRRFAKRLMMKPWMGHEWGAKKIHELLGWCIDLGVEEVTLYAFSIENFDRPKKEFDFLMDIFEKEFADALKNPNVEKNGIKFNFIGRIDMFPERVSSKMKELMKKTKDYDKLTVNFAMAYGGRAEILDASKKLFEKVQKGEVKEINEEEFRKCLYLQNYPDLIIRTSESRLSGFLLWQGSYSEIIFLPDIMWPEFTKQDLKNSVKEFYNRKRRFGR